MDDGSKRGTFRSYTAFFGGGRVTVRDLSISNSAGDGRVVGQALAVYADAGVCLFENVKMTGHQDTLFCAPLPRTERQKGGFTGPGVDKPRRLTKQYYRKCIITGDVDFIFGGADAVFDDCEIIVNNRQAGQPIPDKTPASGQTLDKDQIDTTERFINGYVTAGCGRSEDMGFVFRNCVVRGDEGCARGSVFLGRPWREQARAVFLNCIMDDTIAKERFSGWGGITKDEPETFYGEYNTIVSDKMADLSEKNPWVRDIDDKIAAEISERADGIINAVISELD
jgi:pectinesterase